MHACRGAGVVDREHGSTEALHHREMRGDRVSGEHHAHRIRLFHGCDSRDRGLAPIGLAIRVVVRVQPHGVEHHLHQVRREERVELVDIRGIGGRLQIGRLVHLGAVLPGPVV